MIIFEPFHKMLGIINEVHKNQKDENDNPLIIHILSATMSLAKAYSDQDLLAISLGQYLFDKTDISKQHLLNEGFSYRVVSTIEILTHDVPSTEYKSRILESKDASRIKYHTLSHLLSFQTNNILQYRIRKSFLSDIRISLGDSRLITPII